MTLPADLAIVTPPSLHLQASGRRVLLASRDPEVTSRFAQRAYDLWPDQAVALYLWDPQSVDAVAWLLHHMAYCHTIIIDLSVAGDDLLILLAGRHIGSNNLHLLASGERGDVLVPLLAPLHPHPVARRIDDLVEHLAAETAPHFDAAARPGELNV